MRFSTRREIPSLLLVLLLFTGPGARGLQNTSVPVADVYQVMALADANSLETLWPGFKPSEIPALVFDGVDTRLFHSASIPEGFVREKAHPGVFIFPGQYPQVRGNSATRLGETWMATSVLIGVSRRTGEQYTLKDMAGIIVHEMFHVFQKTHHPQWRQNDGLLLRYPEETPETLFLRRQEKEAFKRAVVSAGKPDIAGWAAAALRYRSDRLGGLAAPFAQYEKELQRTEGISDYIERVARGLDPLNASNITNGIAPSGIRDLGYVEGRWIAMILDKLNPEWKSILEKDDTLFLEDILRDAVAASPGEKKAFTDKEVEVMRTTAQTDFSNWQSRKKSESEAYAGLPGYRLEIDSSARPLGIRLFEPLAIEILDDGSVFHKVVFSAANESGGVRIMNNPCLTWFNDNLRVVRLSVNGLKQAPEIVESEKKLIMNSDGISIELKYTTLSVQDGDHRYRIML